MTEERRAGGPDDGPSRTLRRLLLGISLLLAILLSIASRTQRGGIPAGVAASDHGHLHTALQDFVTVRVESVGLEHLRGAARRHCLSAILSADRRSIPVRVHDRGTPRGGHDRYPRSAVTARQDRFILPARSSQRQGNYGSEHRRGRGRSSPPLGR